MVNPLILEVRLPSSILSASLGVMSCRIEVFCGDAPGVVCFDAGVHPDGKPHTGACHIVTTEDVGPVSAESCRQQIVTKSSTEAELVALSDSINQLIHLRRFLIEQGHQQEPAIIYQDNMTCMAFIDKGRSASKRTRHISIIYFWAKEKCDNGDHSP